MSIHKAPQPAILKVFDWKQLIGAVTLHLFPSRKHITVVLYKLAVCWVLGEELNYMEWAECSVHLCCHKKKKQSYKSKIGRNLGVTGQRLYPSLNYFLIIVDTVIWTKPSGCFLIRSIISSAFKLLWNSGGPALPVSGSSDTDHSQTDLTVRRCLTLEHLSKKKNICTLIIARVTGQVAWPYLQIITVWIRDGGGGHLHMHDQQNADAFLCQHY